MPTVAGTLRLTSPSHLPPAAVARVRLLDVSEADAPARVVGECVLPDVGAKLSAGAGVPFTLTVDRIDSRASYVVSAHVATRGSSQVESGDHISTRSYPVLTHGHGSQVEVLAERVP